MRNSVMEDDEVQQPQRLYPVFRFWSKRDASDRGREFYNVAMKKMLATKKVKLYSVFSQETKASIAERFIRTLNGKFYKFMRAHNTLKYMQALPDIVKTYNLTPSQRIEG